MSLPPPHGKLGTAHSPPLPHVRNAAPRHTQPTAPPRARRTVDQAARGHRNPRSENPRFRFSAMKEKVRSLPLCMQAYAGEVYNGPPKGPPPRRSFWTDWKPVPNGFLCHASDIHRWVRVPSATEVTDARGLDLPPKRQRSRGCGLPPQRLILGWDCPQKGESPKGNSEKTELSSGKDSHKTCQGQIQEAATTSISEETGMPPFSAPPLSTCQVRLSSGGSLSTLGATRGIFACSQKSLLQRDSRH